MNGITAETTVLHGDVRTVMNLSILSRHHLDRMDICITVMLWMDTEMSRAQMKFY